jgi:hypothetical protein
MKLIAKFWIGIAVLVLVSPIGFILPDYFKAGSAWGEWRVDQIQRLLGYVPEGLGNLSGLWNAPMPDYAFKGQKEGGLKHFIMAYIVPALLGIIVIVTAVLLIGRFLSIKEQGE